MRNSPVDRLQQLILLAVADVKERFSNYRNPKIYSDEADAKTERTATLIDEILYQLYGLTSEEVGTLGETV